MLIDNRLYYELFRQYVLVLYEHKEIESEINGCYEVIKFLAHLFCDEIKCFVERTEVCLTFRMVLIDFLLSICNFFHYVFFVAKKSY